MTLQEISTKVLGKLEQEAGSNDWWTEAEIKAYTNDLYKELARLLKNLTKRDATTVSVADQVGYTIPVTGVIEVIRVLEVFYNKERVEPASINQLNRKVHEWRELSSGTPWAWYFERGEENVKVSFVCKPGTADLEIAIEFSYVPSTLSDSDSPAGEYKNGMILINGVMSMALAKAGGGRDLDRSDYYWGEMVALIPGLSDQLQPGITRSFGSIDEDSDRQSFRLGSNYPPYHLDD